MSGMAYLQRTLHCQYGLYEGSLWDGGIVHPISYPQCHRKMNWKNGWKLARVVAKLNRSSVYPPCLKNVFRVSIPLHRPLCSRFCRNTSWCWFPKASKYDKVVRQGKDQFSADESKGYEILKANVLPAIQNPSLPTRAISTMARRGISWSGQGQDHRRLGDLGCLRGAFTREMWHLRLLTCTMPASNHWWKF